MYQYNATTNTNLWHIVKHSLEDKYRADFELTKNYAFWEYWNKQPEAQYSQETLCKPASLDSAHYNSVQRDCTPVHRSIIQYWINVTLSSQPDSDGVPKYRLCKFILIVIVILKVCVCIIYRCTLWMNNAFCQCKCITLRPCYAACVYAQRAESILTQHLAAFG